MKHLKKFNESQEYNIEDIIEVFSDVFDNFDVSHISRSDYINDAEERGINCLVDEYNGAIGTIDPGFIKPKEWKEGSVYIHIYHSHGWIYDDDDLTLNEDIAREEISKIYHYIMNNIIPRLKNMKYNIKIEPPVTSFFKILLSIRNNNDV